MVLEVAILDVIPGQTPAFEIAFTQAQTILASMEGYISHELQKCIETPTRYILLVKWRSRQDHTEGFRKSAAYQDWKALLHHYYDPFPVVEHYCSLLPTSSESTDLE